MVRRTDADAIGSLNAALTGGNIAWMVVSDTLNREIGKTLKLLNVRYMKRLFSLKLVTHFQLYSRRARPGDFFHIRPAVRLIPRRVLGSSKSCSLIIAKHPLDGV